MKPKKKQPTHEAKCQQYFEEQLPKLPFSKVLSAAPHREELYRQFKEAELKPSLPFYISTFFSEKEIKEGHASMRGAVPIKQADNVEADFIPPVPFDRKVREIGKQFWETVGAGKLPKDCYCPDLGSTTICRKLEGVYSTFEILLKSVFLPETDRYREPKIRAKGIIQFLDELQNKALANDLIKELLGFNWKNRLVIEEVVNGKQVSNTIREKAEAIKDSFNSLLKDALPAASQPTAGGDAVAPPPAGSKKKAPLKLKWLKDWNALMRLIKVLEGEELIPEGKGEVWAGNVFYNSAGEPFKSKGTFEPMLWKRKDNLLCYLINELEGTLVKKGPKWAWAEKNFIDEEGEPIKNFAQKAISYKNSHNKKPLDTDVIDQIIAALKKL